MRLAAAVSLVITATALQNGGKPLTSLPSPRANTLHPAGAASSLDDSNNLESQPVPRSYAQLEAYERFRKGVKPSDFASFGAKAAALQRLFTGVRCEDDDECVIRTPSSLRAEISDALKILFPGLMIFMYGVLLTAAHIPRTW